MAVSPPSENRAPLPTISLHYDGWLALPADARKHLDIATGDRLELEFTEAGLLLRPAKPVGKSAAPEPEVVVAQPAVAPVNPMEAETAAPKRAVGRPRKVVTQELAPRIKVGGRRKNAPAA
jgi:bifunctional DNA-binding transcriptional regulator/antitoxin component of YhaV-PrlF toxin-antitoxin module